MQESEQILRSVRAKYDEESRRMRLKALQSIGHDLTSFSISEIKAEDVVTNTESFIGSTTIPTGVVGPLDYFNGKETEKVFALAATSEGALIASMNRGVQVLNQSGGYKFHVRHQKMVRAPVFRFKNMDEAVIFEKWISTKKKELNLYIKKYSHHAHILNIRTIVIGNMVECKFSYETGDAAGQNMTTSCTWHACLKIEADFNQHHSFHIESFILDCNGSSDKKISYFHMGDGRGVHVACEALIPAEVLRKKLKVKSIDCVRWLQFGRHISSFDGVVGYNVNVANAIASLFLATGQDMACVHESSVGLLHVEDRNGDLYLCLNLPRLVIGTVGGGTSLTSFKQALNLMGCYGPGKIERFASLIAGFTLGLELSTMSALVSGEFAIAHERLGRNKPIDVLKRDDWRKGHYLAEVFDIKNLVFVKALEDNNGVLTQLSKSSGGKHLGLDIWENQITQEKILFKSKATDRETLNSLYKLTGFVHPKLSKSFCILQDHCDFIGTHLREPQIYQTLKEAQFKNAPHYYGSLENADKEVYILGMEYLEPTELEFINSEDSPDLWSIDHVHQSFKAIAEAQYLLTQKTELASFLSHKHHQSFCDFARTTIEIMDEDPFKGWEAVRGLILRSISWLENLENPNQKMSHVVVHNDFNPRNIAWNKVRGPMIYDWELATFDLPTRDPIELLCFVGGSHHLKHLHLPLLESFQEHFEAQFNIQYTKEIWSQAWRTSLARFVVSRYVLYLAGSKIMGFKFIPHLTQNALLLEKELTLS
jgi:hydroxymethylglutaryl-CoA reductase (NADPH)